MIWFKYGEHDYMDVAPNFGFKLFESEEQAYAWEKHMLENYSGGRTWIIGPASKDEIQNYVLESGIQLDEKTLANIDNPNNYIR